MNKKEITKKLEEVEKDLTFAISKQLFSQNDTIKTHYKFERNRLYNEKLRLQDMLRNAKD